MLTSTSSAIATSRRRITSTVTGSSAGAAGVARRSLTAVNVDLLEHAHREGIARSDQRARSVFLDQRRAAAGKTDRQDVAVEDRRVEEAVLLEIENRPPARARGGCVTVAGGRPRPI